MCVCTDVSVCTSAECVCVCVCVCVWYALRHTSFLNSGVTHPGDVEVSRDRCVSGTENRKDSPRLASSLAQGLSAP